LAGRGAAKLLSGYSANAFDSVYEPDLGAAEYLDFYMVGPSNDARIAATTTADEKLALTAMALGDHLARAEHCGVTRCAEYLCFGNSGDAAIRLFTIERSSIAELLSDFDLGSGQVAWDGRRVYLTELGRFAAVRRMNVAHHPGGIPVSPTYEWDIIEAMHNGYGLVLPELGSAQRLGALKWEGIEHSGCLCCLTATGVARCGPVVPLDDCGFSVQYVPGLDVRTIIVRTPEATFEKRVRAAITPSEIKHGSLVQAVGREFAIEIVKEVIETGAASSATISRAAAAHNKRSAELFPFEIRAPAKIRICAREWYGSAWIYQ
jgi:hypothetical protein